VKDGKGAINPILMRKYQQPRTPNQNEINE